MNRRLPELYAYIFRNVLVTSEGNHIVSTDCLDKSITKVVRRAPRIVIRAVISEMIHEYGVITQLADNRFMVQTNPIVDRQLRKLKPHVFPIDLGLS